MGLTCSSTIAATPLESTTKTSQHRGASPVLASQASTPATTTTTAPIRYSLLQRSHGRFSALLSELSQGLVEEDEKEMATASIGPTLNEVIDDVLFDKVVSFLAQAEVVGGLGETSKYLRGLIKRRFPVVVRLFPREVVRVMPGWDRVEGVKTCLTEWERRGVRFEEFVEGLTVDESRFFRFSDVKAALRQSLDLGGSLASCFDLQGLQALSSLKNIEFEGVEFDSSSLEIIQSMTALESLVFKTCYFESALKVYPPNLKKLTAHCQASGIQIEDIPESVESIALTNICLPVSLDSQGPFPSGLKILEMTHLGGNQGGDGCLPFEFPPLLESLKISSMSFQTLPLLKLLAHLRILELNVCENLNTLPELPPSLRKLKLDQCPKIGKVTLPNDLEVLECVACKGLDISEQSSRLRILTVRSCKKLGILNKLSVRIEELHLENVNELETLPKLPLCLRSLTLKGCSNLKRLSPFPPALRVLILERLAEMQNDLSLSEELSHLTLKGCKKLMTMGQIPTDLKTLEIVNMELSIVDPTLPDGLKSLIIRNSRETNIHFTRLPLGLERLCLRDLPEMAYFPKFPKTLKTLKLSSMSELKVLADFPEDLEELVISDCGLLSFFPTLPPRLKTLKLRGCHQVEYVGVETERLNKIGVYGKLPETLKDLSLIECDKLTLIGHLPHNLRRLCIKDSNSRILMLAGLPPSLQILDV